MNRPAFHAPISILNVSPPPRRRAGYTLLELLAALTLTVLLASATLAITKNLMHQAKEPTQTAPAWIRRLKQTLLQEMTEAEQVRRVPQGMELEGPLHPKPSVTDTGHRPLKVTWKVDNGQLVREELDLLTGGFRHQVVALGVDRLDLVQPANQGAAGTYQLTLGGSALPQGLILSVPHSGEAP